MTTAGAVTYIISGSATLNFYIPQKSTEQYPRSSGLALASLTIITGAVFLVHVLIEICLLVGRFGDEIVIDTRLPLYRPKIHPKSGTQGVFSVDVLRGHHHDKNQHVYHGQTVKEDFKPS